MGKLAVARVSFGCLCLYDMADGYRFNAKFQFHVGGVCRLRSVSRFIVIEIFCRLSGMHTEHKLTHELANWLQALSAYVRIIEERITGNSPIE